MIERISIAISMALLICASGSLQAQLPRATQLPAESQRRLEQREKMRQIRSLKIPGATRQILKIPEQQWHRGGGDVTWHPRSNSLFVAGSPAVVWDVPRGMSRDRLAGASLWGGTPLAWSPDGKILAVQTDHDLRAPMDTILLGELEYLTDINCLHCLLPFGGVPRQGSPITPRRRIVSTDPSKKLGRITRAAFSPDGARLALLDINATIAVYDVATMREVTRISRVSDRPDRSGNAVESIPIFFDWSPASSLLVGIARETSPGVRTMVQIRTGDDGGEKFGTAFFEANARTTAAFFNPADPTQYLTVGNDLAIVDAISRATIRTIPVGRAIRTAEWRSDGGMILSVTDANILQIWNPNGTQVRTTEAIAASWSPDGTKLAIGRRTEVLIQKGADGSVLATLPMTRGDLFAGPFAWRPSGDAITGRADDFMYIWPLD